MALPSNFWISAHVFMGINSENFQSITMKSVEGLVKSLQTQISIRKFFYIYYSEKGPHLRIRLQLFDNNDRELVERLIVAFFNQYFADNPTTRDEIDLKKHQLVLQKNDSLIFEPYVRETNRYLGRDAIDICEDHFWLSTKSILEVFRDNDRINESKRIQISIQSQVSLLLIFKISSMVEYFDNTFNAYFDYYFGNLIGTNEKTRLIDTYDLFYKTNRDGIIREIRKMSNAIANNLKFENQWFNEWIEENQKIRKKLEFLETSGLPKDIEVSKRLISFQGLDSNQAPLMYLCDSLTHMHSNRLGISNSIETLILYCLKKSCAEINF
jgi:thiopeptide-type bacteriocin biosynthesis protein